MKTGKNLSIAESVYDYIVELILTQQIKPGERIPEAHVGQQLSVSRTPVREAIRRLESEGLVVVSTNRCVEVISFDEQSLVNIGVMRLALEQTSIRLPSTGGATRTLTSYMRSQPPATKPLRQERFLNGSIWIRNSIWL